MGIKRKFQVFFVGLLSILALSCLAALWAADLVNTVSDVETRRLNSLKLAQELRQSSDDLSRMAAVSRQHRIRGSKVIFRTS